MLARQATRLEKLETVDQLWQDLTAALRAEGIDHVIYLTVGVQFDAPFSRSTLPGIYSETPPAQDPFLSHCCNCYEITRTGLEHIDEHKDLDRREREFIIAAADHGFRSGLGIPMRLQGSTRFGGFNLGTALDKAAFEETILPRAEEFRAYCLLAHRRIEELTEQRPLSLDDFRSSLVVPRMHRLAALSPRESEVVYLLAQGLSRKEVARECAISVHTVSDYAKSAYAKLGVRNAVQAALLVYADN